MSLSAKHAESFGFQSVVIVTVDTDIAVYSVYFQQFLEVESFAKIGNGKDKRLLKITKTSSELGKDLCAALPAHHCFTVNDYTSAFYGIGKTRAFKAIQRNEDFINLLPYLTDEQIIDDDRDSEEEDMDIDDLENDYFLDE